jgi:hypothetical protein
MKRSNSSRSHRHQRQNVLQLRVVTPRIVWFGFLRYTGGLVKLLLVLSALAGLGWAAWRGIRHTLFQNPDFRLAVIDLNQNPVIDELGVAALTGVDLTQSPSLFDINVRRTNQRLNAHPALVEARVERHMPGTLVVRVVPRSPRAWVSDTPDDATLRTPGGLLVDINGIVYPCPEHQLESASLLPAITLMADPEHPLRPGKRITHPAFPHCLSLLSAARIADPQSDPWIDTIRPANEWSLLLTTRHGTQATFSLGDHERQMEQLRAALDHASNKGMSLATINLIPKYNVPVTLHGNIPPPRALPVAPDSAPTTGGPQRRNRDLTTILNRP